MPRRARLLCTRRLVVVVLCLAALLLAWAAYATYTARRALLDTRAALVAVRDDDAMSRDTETLRKVVADAQKRSAAADRAMRQVGPALVARVPIAGRSVAAVRDVAAAADATLRAGNDLLVPVQDLQRTSGVIDLTAAGELRRALERSAVRTRGPLRKLSRTPTGWTPGAVGAGVGEARDALLGIDHALQRGADGVSAAVGLLGGNGPRTLVLGVMNNAEARGAGGYVSSFAVVTAVDGRVSVGPFRDVNDVQELPSQARRVPAPAAYALRYGRYLADTTVWKNVTMSPDAPASAAVMCGVARLRPGVSCDGVLLVDVPALAQIMALAGPVRIGGQLVGRDELVHALLVEAYADVPDTVSDQAARRAKLRSAADSALSRLLDRRLTGPAALRVLVAAAQGRHLAVWSAVPSEQEQLVTAGIAGSADPRGADLSLVSLNQFSAGKLDYYLHRAIDIDVEVGPHQATVVQRVGLFLDAPPGLPRYVLGVKKGRLDELVDLGVSAAARDISLRRDGVDTPHDLVQDTGSRRVVTTLSLLAGQRATYELRYTVPLQNGRYALSVLPQPLANDADLRLRVRPTDGFRLHDVKGEVDVRGRLDARRQVSVRAAEPSWWNRPLHVPWS